MFKDFKSLLLNPKALFFKNIGTKQTVIKNTFWLTLSEAITGFLKFIFVIYVAKILGATEYGKFSFALSFVTIVVILSEMGLPDIITREFSKNKESEKDYPAILSFKLFLSLICFILMVGGAFFITSDPIIRVSIIVLGIFILITSFLNVICAFFRAREKMEYESVFKITQHLFLIFSSFIVLFFIPSVKNLSYAYLFSNLVILIITLLFFNFFVSRIKLYYDKKIWHKFFKFSWPLSPGFVIGWIYVSLTSIMLGYFGYNIENGWYNAAYKIIGALAISATLVSRSFFPVLSRFSKESKIKIQRIWNYQEALMAILSFPMIMGGIILAPQIINLFYDASYNPSILAFQWLVIVCGIDFMYYPYASSLVVFGREKVNFVLIVIGLIINIILNFIFIPKYTLYGAVLSTTISSVVVFLLAIVCAKIYTPISPFNIGTLKILLSIIISALIMFIFLFKIQIYEPNLFLSIFLGAGVYFLTLLVFYKIFNNNFLKWKRL